MFVRYAGKKGVEWDCWVLGVLVILTVVNANAATITHCPTNRILVASTDCTAALPNLTVELESTDGGAVTQEPTADSLLGIGTNLVMFTVTDTNGLSASCSALLTVVDEIPPVIVSGPTNLAL